MMTQAAVRSAFGGVRSALDGLPAMTIVANTLRQFPEQVRAVALHEAGHTVVGLALGADVRSVRLFGAGRGESDIQGRFGSEAEAAIVAGGHVAAIMLDEPRHSVPDPILTRLERRALDKAIERAESILRIRLTGLYALACALAARGRLSGAEARAVVKGSGVRLS